MSEENKVDVKPRNTDKKRIEKLESDVKQIKEMLHKMKSAIGLPDSILPKLDN
jgi:hypothetical protein